MSWLSNLFGFFTEFFAGLINFIKQHWLVILIAVAAVILLNPALAVAIGTWFTAAATTVGGWLALGATSIGIWLGSLSLTQLLIGAAALWVISDPDGAIGFITDAIVEVTTALAAGVAAGVSSIIGKPVMYAAGALGLLWLVGRDNDEDEGHSRGTL